MKKIIILTLFALVVVISGCKENAASQPESRNLKSATGLSGTWVEVRYDEDGLLLTRANSLCDDKYGFIINDNGEFIERKNIGWCGTPPVVYGNYEGTWEAVNDSVLHITVPYWGGTMDYSLQVLSATPSEIKVKYLYEGQ